MVPIVPNEHHDTHLRPCYADFLLAHHLRHSLIYFCYAYFLLVQTKLFLEVGLIR